MKEQLKPCPFCGGEPILNHIEPHTHFMQFNGEPLMPDYPGSWTIECCDVGMIKDTREEVETAWNRREPSAPVEQAAPVTVPNGWKHTLSRAAECLEIFDKRPRPMCRDCADEDGICPNGGLDCDMHKLIADVRALAAAPAPSKDKDADWQPMEAAPKDRDILLLCPHRGVVRGYWQPNKYAKKPKPYWTNDREHWFGVAATRADQPIGWMELPTASQSATQKEGE